MDPPPPEDQQFNENESQNDDQQMEVQEEEQQQVLNLNYPLCEFHSRFQNTRFISIEEKPAYFRSYVRSAKNRYRSSKGLNPYQLKDIEPSHQQINLCSQNQIYFNPKLLENKEKKLRINSKFANHLGLLQPFQRNKQIEKFMKEIKLQIPKEDIYDQYISYCYQSSRKVEEKFVGLRNAKKRIFQQIGKMMEQRNLKITEEGKNFQIQKQNLILKLNQLQMEASKYEIVCKKLVEVTQKISKKSKKQNFSELLPLIKQLLLQFQTKISKEMEQLQKKKIVVKVWNQYPCVLVYPPFPSGIQRKKKKYFCQLFMCMFVAECLRLACLENIPIEMVLRSSIGHILPSVSQIDEAFRINVGIVPYFYIQNVINKALQSTEKQYLKLLSEKVTAILDQTKKKNYINHLNEILLNKATSDWRTPEVQQFVQRIESKEFFTSILIGNIQAKIKFVKQLEKDVETWIFKNENKIKLTEKVKTANKIKEIIKKSCVPQNQQNQLMKQQCTIQNFFQSKASPGNSGKCLLAQMLRAYNSDYFVDLIFKDQSQISPQKLPVDTSPVGFQDYLHKLNLIAVEKMISLLDEKKKKDGEFSFNKTQIKLELKNFQRVKIQPSAQTLNPEFILISSVILKVFKEKKIENMNQEILNDGIMQIQSDQDARILGQFYSKVQKGVKYMIKTQYLQNSQRNPQQINEDKSSYISLDFLRHQKIIVSSGMGAILLAILAANCEVRIGLGLTQNQSIGIDAIHMYYQTQQMSNVFSNLNLSNKIDQEISILVYDLNYINKNLKNQKRLEERIIEDKGKGAMLQYIILDTTTSTSSQILQEIKKIHQRNDLPRLKAILTVASALKFQQLGQDLYQWGEIRIFQPKNQVKQTNYTQLFKRRIQSIMSIKSIFGHLAVPEQIQIVRKALKKYKFVLRISDKQEFWKLFKLEGVKIKEQPENDNV